MKKYEVVPRHTKEDIVALLMEQTKHLMVKVRDGVYRPLEPTDKVVVKNNDGYIVTYTLTVEGKECNLIRAHQHNHGLYLCAYPAPNIQEPDPLAIVDEAWYYSEDIVDYYNSLEEEYQNSLKK